MLYRKIRSYIIDDHLSSKEDKILLIEGARPIGVNRSTVCREIRRNSNRQGKYWWSIAHERALDRRERTVRNRETPPDVLREAKRLLVKRD